MSLTIDKEVVYLLLMSNKWQSFTLRLLETTTLIHKIT